MLFTDIANRVCTSIKKDDANSVQVCLGFASDRSQMIYDGFDWKAAQKPLEMTVDGTGNVSTVAVPLAQRIISVQFDRKMLDPVSLGFIIEQSSGPSHEDYFTPGTPKFFEEFRDLSSGQISIRLFPPLLADGNPSHPLVVLCKQPYDPTWTSPPIPSTLNALLAYVEADMLLYMQNAAKSQLKLAEAKALEDQARQLDTPPILRPRTSARLTAEGNTLSELTDSVCDIVSDWTPISRIMIKERIRRNWQNAWDMALWQESVIFASAMADANGFAVLPPLIDRVLRVRWNVDLASLSFRLAEQADLNLWMGVKPGVFDQVGGTPCTFSSCQPVAVLGDPQSGQLTLVSDQVETFTVTIKGEAGGIEVWEDLVVSNTPATTSNSYDTVLSLQKPENTIGNLTVTNASAAQILSLFTTEQGRKHQRIRLLPNFAAGADTTLLVLGKRKVPQMLADGDTCVLTGIQDTLINMSAADILLARGNETAGDAQADAFLKSGKMAVIQALQQKAQISLQNLMDREIQQGANNSVIQPFVEYPSTFNPGYATSNNPLGFGWGGY